MKQKKKNFSQKINAPQVPPFSLLPFLTNNLPAIILALTFFAVPFFPDEKLNRLKLIALGTGLIFTGVLWAALKVLPQNGTFYRTPLDPYLAFYFVSAILYYQSSENPAVAASELQRMIFSVGAFFVAVQVCSGPGSERLKKMVLGGWVGGLFLISLYGILQKTGGAGTVQVPQMDRVFGTFGNPIFFAAFLISSIPVALAWMMEAKNFWFRTSLFACTAVSLWALFYTGTRAAFIALPSSLSLFYVLLDYRQNWNWTKTIGKFKSHIITLLAALLLGIGLFSYFVDPQPLKKLVELFHGSRITATQQTHTLIWKDTLKMWMAHPWVGTGYGTFHIEFPQYASEELKRNFPQHQRIVNDAHNEYLQILAETGIAGFLIFSSILFMFYFAALKNFYSRSGGGAENQDSLLATGLLSGATALLIQNIFSVDMRFIVSSTYLFFAMGLVFSYFSEPVTVRLQTGWGWTALKGSWILFFVGMSGLAGFSLNPKGFYIAGIYHFSADPHGNWSWKKTTASGAGLLPSLLRPYLAQKVLAQTPDFFDEKLLNSAQTIYDLENLTRQYPQQWKYWEKLGFALAKEIQKKDPTGKKMNDFAAAEKAITAYLKAHQLNPQAEGPPNNIGNVYYTMNYRREAMEWWQKAIDSNPGKIDARLNLGLAYYFEGKVKESARQFEEVLKLDPKNEKAIVMLKRMVE